MFTLQRFLGTVPRALTFCVRVLLVRSRRLGMGGSTGDLAQEMRGVNLISASAGLVLPDTRRLTLSG